MGGEQESISKFENSLTDYLVNAQSSQFTDVMSFAYRYNNLKFFMAPSKVREPHFFVRLGISEACFSIQTGNKIDGSLGPEDRFVQKWCSRINIQRELDTYWKALTQEIKNKELGLATRSSMPTDDGLGAVDMTSTGISKSKRIIEQERKKRLLRFKKDKRR